eukprot:4770037-Amphidinium_carterae.1
MKVAWRYEAVLRLVFLNGVGLTWRGMVLIWGSLVVEVVYIAYGRPRHKLGLIKGSSSPRALESKSSPRGRERFKFRPSLERQESKLFRDCKQTR